MLYCIRPTVFLGEGSNYILIHLILTSERMPMKFFNNTIVKRITFLEEFKGERPKASFDFYSYLQTHRIHRGSYMSANVLLNLLNELGKRDKMRGLPSILSLFRNEFNKFNNTRARMLDSIYHMTNYLKSHF